MPTTTEHKTQIEIQRSMIDQADAKVIFKGILLSTAPNGGTSFTLIRYTRILRLRGVSLVQNNVFAAFILGHDRDGGLLC